MIEVIPCRQYFGTNVIGSSYIEVNEISKILQGLKVAAQEWKKIYESDYVLYAAKIYNNEDTLCELRLYSAPLTKFELTGLVNANPQYTFFYI